MALHASAVVSLLSNEDPIPETLLIDASNIAALKNEFVALVCAKTAMVVCKQAAAGKTNGAELVEVR